MNLYSKTKSELIALIQSTISEPVSDHYKVYDLLKTMVSNWDRENFIVIFMNVQNKVVHKEVIFTGAVSSCAVDSLIIFKQFLKFPKASRLIVAHNHPSGTMEASIQDLAITRRIKDGAEILGISMLDSIIFSETQCMSIMEKANEMD